jgi:hypothetical protein
LEQEVVASNLATEPLFDEDVVQLSVKSLKDHKAAAPSFFTPALL